MDSGKRFEAQFSRSLHAYAEAHDGLAMRIEDGGAKAKNNQLGDFMLFVPGATYCIECKATREKAFPLAQLRETQAESLREFNEISADRHSVVAINFWGETHNDCILIAWADYERLAAEAEHAGRKSIPRKWLELTGKTMERQHSMWLLDFGGLQ